MLFFSPRRNIRKVCALTPSGHRLVLSPHPDDAVWSCGGILDRWAHDGTAVTVVTVFDGTPPNRLPPAGRAARSSLARRRREEDSAGLGRWPITTISLGLPEAAYRCDSSGRALYGGPLSLRRNVHPLDEPITAALADRLDALVDAGDTVIAPMAVGTHVDHLIVRSTVERLCTWQPISYYREFPYRPPLRPGMTALNHTVDFDAWLRPSLAYGSQVDLMFGTPAAFERALARHAGLRPDGTAVWQEWTLSPSGTAIDQQRLAGDERDSGSGEERHHGRHLG